MAAITATPARVNVGSQVKIDGTGFTPETMCVLSVLEDGIIIDVLSDVSGEINSDDLADHAQGTLTSNGTNVTAADTVTIGAVTYTFRAAPSVANEVLIGASAAATLANLKSAINLDGTAVYGAGTVVHPTVGAGALTATTLKVYAKTPGVGGNALAFSKAAATLSVSAANLANGAASTGISPLIYTANRVGMLTFAISDGTNVATTKVQVWNE